jgi:hypothetical protein
MSEITAPELYERDFYSWTQEQSQALRRAADERINAPAGVDWANLATEVWELGLSLELQLYHRYFVLLQHLLKWRYQHPLSGPSWRGAINEQRRRIARLLKKNPGLKPKRQAEFEDAYADARDAASDETAIPHDRFPVTCPFSLEEAESRDFWPASEPDA